MRKAGIILLVIALVALGYFYLQAQRSAAAPLETLAPLVVPDSVLTIAFGSCNHQNDPQGYWRTIASHYPDAWLWLGDNVYSDTDDMERMRDDYRTLSQTPEYAAFVAFTPLIYGGWDDHDYGLNDGGKEWAAKDGAKEELLTFLRVPDDAAVRDHPGTYQSYRIGDVQVIILDTRYFRDAFYPSDRAGSRYGVNPEGDILGEEQWAWLEQELRGSDARAHLITSSIQVLPTDHGYEKWSLFPQARTRLLRLLRATRPALPLLLSGDRHLAEFSADTLDGYTVYEMTSSGLTHSFTGAEEKNDKRLGPLVPERNFGLLHFVETPDGLEVRAEVHALDDDAVMAALTLSAGRTNNAGPSALVPPKAATAMTLKPCPKSPNCVSTQSTDPKKQRDPIAFIGSAEDAKAKLKRVIGEMARTELQQEEGNYLHYTFKTWPIPYIDDVEFIVDAEEKVIHYRSASRVGHSDLGVNGRRMAKVVAAFRGE